MNRCTHSFVPRIAAASFPEVVGVLTLAAKYDVSYLRSRAAEHFSQWYPDSLDAFMNLSIVQGGTSPATAADHLIAIDLARRAGLAAALPAAMLSFVKALWPQPHARLLQLDISKEDHLMFLSAIETLQIKTHIESLRWLYVHSVPNCVDEKKCARWRSGVLLMFEETHFRESLLVFSRLNHVAEYGLCKACIASSEQLSKAGWQQVWDKLPETFTLPSWDELRQNTDLGAH